MLLFASALSAVSRTSSMRRSASAFSVAACSKPANMAPPSKKQKKDLRCSWALSSQLAMDYHDNEWGVPLYDDGKTFEFLILETFQAGLSWRTILQKREGFRKAFCQFDVDEVAKMGEDDVMELLQNKEIVRNKLKIRAAISNAQVTIRMRDEEGLGLADYFWQWTDYKQQCNYDGKSMLSKNELSDEISKDMKKRGFKFIGSTVIYAHLQATGVVNDHDPQCPRFKQVKMLVRKRPKK